MSLKVKFIFFLITLFFYLNFNSTSYAAISFQIKTDIQKIDFNQEFDVDVAISDAPKDNSYYLQIALTNPENPSYFGFTQKNDGSWHSYAEIYDNFYQITINQEGSFSGKIRGKVDTQDKDFKGSGDYILKVRRTTSTGKSHYWSDNNITIAIVGPTNTPIPLPTATFIPTNTLIPTIRPTVYLPNVSATKAIIPTITKIIVLSITSDIKKSITKSPISTIKIPEENILGITDFPNVISSVSGSNHNDKAKKLPIVFYLIILGIVSLVVAIILSFRQIKKEKSD